MQRGWPTSSALAFSIVDLLCNDANTWPHIAIAADVPRPWLLCTRGGVRDGIGRIHTTLWIWSCARAPRRRREAVPRRPQHHPHCASDASIHGQNLTRTLTLLLTVRENITVKQLRARFGCVFCDLRWHRASAISIHATIHGRTQHLLPCGDSKCMYPLQLAGHLSLSH